MAPNVKESIASSERRPGDGSSVSRKQFLIDEAKERMAEINGTPVVYGDNWLSVREKMKHTGWKWNIPAPRINGIPIGGDDFVWLLPTAKKPKEGGRVGIDFLKDEIAAKQFAVDHFNWFGDKEEVKVKAQPKQEKVSDSPQQRNVSASMSKLHNIATPDQDSVPRSYEGGRIAKYFGKKLCFGTVQEHPAGCITALIRFDDGDYGLCGQPELKNLLRLYSENEGDDEHANTKANDNECEKKNKVKQARPVDGEVISIEADDSGNLFWRKESESKDVVVTTIVSGKPISTRMASLPGKSLGRKHTIVKVAKERDGIRYDGSVAGFDSKHELWEVQFPWGSEQWNLVDIEKGFAMYCSRILRAPEILDTCTPIEATDEWLIVWDKLKRSGWRYKTPSGLDTDWKYFAPGKSKVKNPVEGQDYFKGEEAVRAFCKTAYGWDPKGARKVRLLQRAQEEEEQAKLEAEKMTEKARKEKEAAKAAAEKKRLEKAAELEAKRELSFREGTPPLLAQEANEDSAHKPNVDNEASLAERDTKSSIDDFSFEEIEKVYLEKKRERDDIIAAERLPFETLEKIYRERKRQRTTIDLTEENTGPFEPDESDNALRNMARQAKTYSTKLVAVKKEMGDAKEDLEDANELVQQQTLTVDVWQSRFDELAQEPGLDVQKISEIRNRPLSSGR